MLATHLATLEHAGLLHPAQAEPEPAYFFRHALIREAAYQSLLKTDRRTLHLHIGHTLEQLYATQLETLAPVLAQHFAQGGENGKAVHYLLRAGDEARHQFAYTEAIAAYQQAHTLLLEQGDLARAAQTAMRLGLLYQSLLDFENSRVAYAEAFALWEQAATTPAPTPPPARQPLRLTWTAVNVIDPSFISNVGNGAIAEQLFSGLVDFTQDLDIIPALAKRWEMLEGGRRYRFYLRPAWCWSDGVPLTAPDVVLGWHRALSRMENLGRLLLADVAGVQDLPAAPTPTDLALVGVRALTDHTLEVELSAPTGYFLYVLGHPTLSPVPRHQIAALGAAWTQHLPLVSNGPFVLTHHSPDELQLQRNRHYPLPLSGNVQTVIVHTQPHYGAYTARVAAYAAEQLDVLNATASAAEIQASTHPPAGEPITQKILQVQLLHLDAMHPALTDVRVRRALAQSVDAATLCAVVYNHQVPAATGGLVPPGLPGHTPGISLPYAPAQAQQWLAAAGYPGGRGLPPLAFAYEGKVRVQEHLAHYLQTQWGTILGVEIVPLPVVDEDYWDYLRRHTPPINRLGWNADYPDADNFLRVAVLQQTRWRDPTYLQLIERARRLTDPLERQKLHQVLDRLLMQSAVLVPLAYAQAQLFIQPWVKRYPLSPLKALNFSETVLAPRD